MSSREIQRGDQRNTPTSFSLHAPISFWFLLLAIPTKSWKAREPGLDNTWRSMSWHTEQDIAGEWNLRQSENIQERKHTTNSHTPSSNSYQWSHRLRKDKDHFHRTSFSLWQNPLTKKFCFSHTKHIYFSCPALFPGPYWTWLIDAQIWNVILNDIYSSFQSCLVLVCRAISSLRVHYRNKRQTIAKLLKNSCMTISRWFFWVSGRQDWICQWTLALV